MTAEIHAPELTLPQYHALEALLEGRTQAEAASLAKVDPRTLRRWLGQPEFVRALHQARLFAWNEVAGRLHATATRAVDTLLDIMVNNTNPHARLRAARIALELSAKALQSEALFLRSLEPEEPETPAEHRTKADISGHGQPSTPTEPLAEAAPQETGPAPAPPQPAQAGFATPEPAPSAAGPSCELSGTEADKTGHARTWPNAGSLPMPAIGPAPAPFQPAEAGFADPEPAPSATRPTSQLSGTQPDKTGHDADSPWPR